MSLACEDQKQLSDSAFFFFIVFFFVCLFVFY